MQWYEKRPMFPQIFFQRALKWNNPRTTLFVLEDVFQSSRLQNITVFLCTLYKMKKFRFYPLATHPWPSFFELPTPFPKVQKTFWKIGAVYADLIHAMALSGLKIKPMQLSQCRHVHGFSHMTFIYLLLCWKMFQHALLKALFHNVAMTTLIEHTRTFLYMQ